MRSGIDLAVNQLPAEGACEGFTDRFPFDMRGGGGGVSPDLSLVHKKKARKLPSKQPSASVQEAADAEALQLFLDSLQHIDPAAKDDRDTAEHGASGKAKKGRGPTDVIKLTVDLHRLTLTEAFHKIDEVFEGCLSLPDRRCEITVITGKGSHSATAGGVLSREVHGYVVARYQAYILSIESSPHETAVEGSPWRGHFKVVLKGRRATPR